MSMYVSLGLTAATPLWIWIGKISGHWVRRHKDSLDE